MSGMGSMGNWRASIPKAIAFIVISCLLAYSLVNYHLIYPFLLDTSDIVFFEFRDQYNRAFATDDIPPCSSETDISSKPNVIVILVDALRADHISCMGHERETSPNMCALAEDGILFRNMHSNTPSTKESVACLFTSKYSSQHNVIDNSAYLSLEHDTLAEMMGSVGYKTVGVNANYVISDVFGYSQGFNLWLDGHQMIASELNDRLFGGLDGDGPFFIYLHYMDPHHPYSAPAEYYTHFNPLYQGNVSGRERLYLEEVVDLFLDETSRITPLKDYYDNEIYYFDDMIGQLIRGLKSRGLYDDTVIFLVSDHGEHFGEHDLFLHSNSLYSEVISVPLIVRDPGRTKGIEVSSAVQTIDLMPTILGIAGITCDLDLAGDNIFDVIAGDDRPVFSEHLRTVDRDPSRSMRIGKYLLIRNLSSGDYSLFDVKADPGELQDIYAEDEISREMTVLMQSFEKKMASSEQNEAEVLGEDEISLEKLRALGYAYS
ncbi:sulfatase [Candidatus Altiarchaeota archaeon]